MDVKFKHFLFILLSCIFLILTIPNIFQLHHIDRIKADDSTPKTDAIKFSQYSSWPSFLTDPSFDLTLWREFCWNHQTSLPSDDPQLYYKKNFSSYAVCRDVLKTINAIYEIKSGNAQVQYPEQFAKKILKMFNQDEKLFAQAQDQSLYFVMNKYSFEHTVYNPLRGRRPIQKPEMPVEDYVTQTIEKTRENCDLCNFQNMTAIDPLGRFENRYAYSAANAFKFDQWHSMFIPKNHDITNLTLAELKDVFTLAWKWIRAVHRHSPKHRYATILWDSLPHGGASQVHPHIHGTVHTDHFYGNFESLRYAAERYYREWKDNEQMKQKNFFRAIQDVHLALNLTIALNGISVIVPITSRKEFDLIVLAENFDERVVEVIYQILQGFFHRLKQFSFSSCLYLPSLSSTSDDRAVTPVFFRIIPRGQASSLMSEVSSLDLLSIANVNKLPSDLYAEVSQWFQQNGK